MQNAINNMKNTLSGLSVFVGRILIASIFVFSAMGKITNFQGAVAYSHSVGIFGIYTGLTFLLISATILEIIGAVSFILGYKIKFGAICLLIFMVPVTLLFHGFWRYSGQEAAMQMINFMKNVCMTGGILFVLGIGAGPFSLDNVLKNKNEKVGPAK